MIRLLKGLVLSAFMTVGVSAWGQNGNSAVYQYTIDLQKVENDQVKVSLLAPPITAKKALFIMPKAVPGTYARKDFGRFLTDFKAYDKRGKRLKVSIKDKSDFYIKKANKLHKIEYLVNDTWDNTGDPNFVFQPGGSNIEADKNFMLNHFAFVGYFDGLKNKPYEITVKKPQGFFGATPLKKTEVNATTDKLYAPNYVFLADNPTMYSLPDTASFRVANTQVRFSVYSPNNYISAAQIAEYAHPMAIALADFFGKMPVEHYDFLFYFADPTKVVSGDSGLSGFGALEHSYSSVYFLPEMKQAALIKDLVMDVATHEFLHILTPLNIHSREIEDFDFRDPKMSQHLWMYEGVTEYFANLVQLQGNLIDKNEFKQKMQRKIKTAAGFQPMSFTDMSRQILREDLQDDYLNVYEKGALIGWALDLLLIKESQGKMNLRSLMLQLAEKYGPNRPFEDDKLLDEIVSLTSPAVRQFFDDYVVGDKTIDYNKFLNMIGWEYDKEKEVKSYSLGEFGLGMSPDGQIKFRKVGDNILGLKENDRLLKVNGQLIDVEHIVALVSVIESIEKGSVEPVEFVVEREGEEITLKGTPAESVVKAENVISFSDNPSPEQQQYYKIWAKE